MRPPFRNLAPALLCLFFCTSAAQVAPADNNAATIDASKLVIREGTEVPLKLAQNVNSRTAKTGEVVEFVVSEPIKVGDIVVADTGSRAIGSVTHSKTPDFWGNPGEMNLRITFLKAGKTKVPLRGALGQVGDIRVVIRGSQAVIKEGTPVKAYVDADTQLDIPVPLSPSAIGSPSAEVVPADRPGTESVATLRAQASLPGDTPATSPDTIRLPNGKAIRLALSEPLSSKTSKVGDLVKLQVLDDVKIGNLVVIANKAPATGTITEVKPAGRAWHSGAMNIRLDSVMLVNQQLQPIDYIGALKGGPTNAAFEWTTAIMQTQGLALFLLPFSPLQHGNQAILPPGTLLEAATRGDTLLKRATIESAQPKPPEIKPGPGAVTIYYPNSTASGSAVVWCGSEEIGRVTSGRMLTITLPPGRYWLRAMKKDYPGTPLDIEQGAEYFLRASFTQADDSRHTWGTRLERVHNDIGKLESTATKPVKSKDVHDPSKMDIAKLQMEIHPNK